MKVYEAEAGDAAEWDAYVYSAPESSFFHLYGWREVMKDTFGLQSRYLMVRDGGECAGVLGLLHVQSRLTGNFVTSTPGAICARDENATSALIERAKEIVRSVGGAYLSLRDSPHKLDQSDLVVRENHATFLVRLPQNADDVVQLLDRSARRDLKTAIAANIEVVHGVDHLGDYYPVYSQAMRNLGTPTMGLAFFQNVLHQFPDIFQIVVASHQDHMVGGGCIAFFKDTVYATWAAMLRQYYHLCTSQLLYFDLLQRGAQNGCVRADLGRSALGSGSYQFKRHFKAEAEPLYQCFYLNTSSEVPSVGGQRAKDGRYQLFVRVWRRLPLPVTEFLGPRLRARMPFG